MSKSSILEKTDNFILTKKFRKSNGRPYYEVNVYSTRGISLQTYFSAADFIQSNFGGERGVGKFSNKNEAYAAFTILTLKFSQ